MDLQRHPKIAFKQDYPIPEGYDEGFSHRVLARLERVDDDAPSLNPGVVTVLLAWSGNARAWAVAASLALVVGGWFLGRLWWSGAEPVIEANASSDLLANLRAEEAHDAVLHSANLELLEEVVEQDPNSQVLLSEWAEQMSNDPVTMQEALTALPHDLGALVEEAEIEI
nr:hypothetical protein [Sphingomonadales bacterium]